ncbi:hypothetical protein FGO68_gene15168 [Halteria grandinella]|uniref:Uncharacterized protein n=1 Tax=Halteria grandinella TaxID=5974 RepID=A0A8J8NR95_HALGN|nr:hypothetical protein FGO68_gene15168 [Halteria grandinella]
MTHSSRSKNSFNWSFSIQQQFFRFQLSQQHLNGQVYLFRKMIHSFQCSPTHQDSFKHNYSTLFSTFSMISMKISQINFKQYLRSSFTSFHTAQQTCTCFLPAFCQTHNSR